MDHKTLAYIVENFDGNIIITDPNMKIRYVSKGYCNLTGYTKEELLGQSPVILHGKETSEDRKRQFKQLVKSKKAGNVKIVNYKKDGTLFWNHVRISPIFDGDGELVYWIGLHEQMPNDIDSVTLAELLEFRNLFKAKATG